MSAESMDRGSPVPRKIRLATSLLCQWLIDFKQAIQHPFYCDHSDCHSLDVSVLGDHSLGSMLKARI